MDLSVCSAHYLKQSNEILYYLCFDFPLYVCLLPIFGHTFTELMLGVYIFIIVCLPSELMLLSLYNILPCLL